jgi:murein DD-endopeptidase MepM/ murein hydrolase activator NlpD
MPDSADYSQDSAMSYKISTLLLVCAISIQSAFNQAGFPRDYFSPPLDIEMYLSGNFGELRSNHFHAGIDIKTQGVSGHRVYAAADGYVSRIKIEAAGYGNTLYITHPAGYTTVYAHLQRFRSDIGEYVLEKQYSNEQHALNIFPGKEEWPVKKGDLVAFSGTSGYSFGPHLHFEIRDASNQEPLNVLLFGFDIEDLVPPRIFALYLYPGDEKSMANNSFDKTRIETTGKDGRYFLKGQDTLSANGSIGFGIEAFDYLNGAHNRCGLYRIRMMVDGELKYEWKMDRFPFSHARYVNSYIDFGERILNEKLVQKTFVDPNNKLRLYTYVENAGMVDFSESRSYRVQFMLEDTRENLSELDFIVMGGIHSIIPEREEENEHVSVFSWSSANEFKRKDVILSLPAGALYTDLKFNYQTEESPPGAFSPVHILHDHCTPIHSACDLSIRPVGLPAELREKALIALLNGDNGDNGDNGIAPVETSWKDGMLTARIREFGRYTVFVDTLEPEIRSLDLDGSGDPAEGKSIRFRVSDETSGIKSYEGYIDNEWVLFEYDAKNDLVFYRFDPERLPSGKSHELELYIIDNKENIAYYYAEFYW